jgi:hypothetical protein
MKKDHFMLYKFQILSLDLSGRDVESESEDTLVPRLHQLSYMRMCQGYLYRVWIAKSALIMSVYLPFTVR